MSKSTIALVAVIAVIAAACARDNETTSTTPSLDLTENISVDESAALPVKDLAYVQLNGDSAAAYFKDAVIIDVVGDTAVLLEKDPSMSRLIMYNIDSGEYLGEINHRGQGPGEYRVILGAFVNGKDGSVLLPNFDNPSVYKYSLAADTLITTIDRKMVMSMIEPVGGTGSAINVATPTPDGLKVLQYDDNYALIDSIEVDGFRGGNFNLLWANAGNVGVFMMADTLYTFVPGAMQPLAILKRGNYALTPEQDQETTMKVMDGAHEIEVLRPYILVRDVQFTDGKMLLTTMHDGHKYSDIYDMDNGSLIYRNKYERLSTPSNIVVSCPDGKTIEVERLFAKEGKWYGIVSEDNVAADSSNCALVCFSL